VGACAAGCGVKLGESGELNCAGQRAAGAGFFEGDQRAEVGQAARNGIVRQSDQLPTGTASRCVAPNSSPNTGQM